MAVEKGDFQKELEYFNQTEEIIRCRLGKLCEENALLKDEVLRGRKEMWEDNRHLVLDFDDVVFLSAQNAQVKFTEERLEWSTLEIQRLRKMEKTPYFGRVDFEESGTGEEGTVYIGIHSLVREESQEILVADWRAPVSSMFYQFDLGPAWYQVHDYTNEVTITGKRQYKIEEGRFLSVYDTDSSMYDDILGEVLSKHSERRLKVIIGSIQKEQNLAIRSDTKRSCLIYGLAGSGKTSIGLHRLAYVLYCSRDTIKSENILILSNNNIFSSYISTILPDLGEKPAQTKVFADLLEAAMEKGTEIEDYYSQLKAMEGGFSGERVKWIRIKYSPELLQYCIDYFAGFSFQIPGIRYKGELLVSPEQIRSRLNAGRYPDFRSRYERLIFLVKRSIEDFFALHKEEICKEFLETREDIFSEKEARILYKITVQEYIQAARDGIRRLNRLDPGKQTTEVFAGYLRRTGEGDEEAVRLSHSLERGKLLYEDAVFYLLIKVLMGETDIFSNIYHTVIDESQDYNLLQLYIIKRLFPRSSFTLLGDIYQTVNSVTTIQKYEDYERIFGAELIQIRLRKCYRSSSDINALAFRLIEEKGRPLQEEYSWFERRVKKPLYVVCKDLFSCLVPILEGLKKYRSAAVIVNSDEEALAAKAYLEKEMEVQLIISPEDEMRGRIVVIPLILAKGLEFDAVILLGLIYANIDNPHLRRRVYLGCTRALHELYFAEKDALPDALRECAPYMEV